LYTSSVGVGSSCYATKALAPSETIHIVNPHLTYLGKAKVLAMAAIDLLWDDVSGAHTILRDYKPPMSHAEYLEFQRGINHTETFDGAA